MGKCLQVLKIAQKNAGKLWQPCWAPKRNGYCSECSKDLPANRPRVAWKKFWCLFLECTLRYESHLLSICGGHSQKSKAICPAFPHHFLPSMLCVLAPCEVELPKAHLPKCPLRRDNPWVPHAGAELQGRDLQRATNDICIAPLLARSGAQSMDGLMEQLGAVVKLKITTD